MSVEIRVPQIYEDDTTEYVTIRADVCCDCAYKPFREAVGLGHGQTHGVLFEVMDGVDPWDRW